MQNTLFLLYTSHQIQQQELLDYLFGRCEEFLTANSSARAIVAGDIIQLPIKDFCLQNNLSQLVTKPIAKKLLMYL